MKVLHLLRSDPNELVQQIINKNSGEESSMEVRLYQDQVDYKQIIEKIFNSDRVICWW